MSTCCDSCVTCASFVSTCCDSCVTWSLVIVNSSFDLSISFVINSSASLSVSGSPITCLSCKSCWVFDLSCFIVSFSVFSCCCIFCFSSISLAMAASFPLIIFLCVSHSLCLISTISSMFFFSFLILSSSWKAFWSFIVSFFSIVLTFCSYCVIWCSLSFNSFSASCKSFSTICFLLIKFVFSSSSCLIRSLLFFNISNCDLMISSWCSVCLSIFCFCFLAASSYLSLAQAKSLWV